MESKGTGKLLHGENGTTPDKPTKKVSDPSGSCESDKLLEFVFDQPIVAEQKSSRNTIFFLYILLFQRGSDRVQ